ncbi:unnamed protein product [Ectocarpus sp. CCAP 1310/34]|nr:unnamed protein product [Ectocarpus sp. CCAP 1310/34]
MSKQKLVEERGEEGREHTTGDNLGHFSAPPCGPTFITLAYDNRGGARCRTRRAGPHHHKGGHLPGQRGIYSRGADMEWMRSAIFGEDTPSPVRVFTRLFTAGGEEKEDSDDAGTREMRPERKKCDCVILFPPCALECCSAQGRGEDSDDEEDDDDTEGSDEEAERKKDMVRDMHDAAAEHDDVRELYKLYVKERKDSVAVELSYPSKR